GGSRHLGAVRHLHLSVEARRDEHRRRDGADLYAGGWRCRQGHHRRGDRHQYRRLGLGHFGADRERGELTMSNTHRGDVDVKAGNKIYTLRLSVGALVQLEEHFGLGINQIAQKLSNTENMRLTDWVAVMWAAMRKHQPD